MLKLNCLARIGTGISLLLAIAIAVVFVLMLAGIAITGV